MRLVLQKTDLLRIISFAVLYFVAQGFCSSAYAQTKLAKNERRHVTRKINTLDRATAEKHPLWPALKMAVESYQHIRKDVRDYSCNVIRRERIRGVLQSREFMTAKVRHQRSRDGKVAVPFGVYLKVLSPSKVKGREVLFVDGQNDGKMLVRNGGKRFAFVTTRISPESETAMASNRYPITDFGFENLVKRLIVVVKEDMLTSSDTDVQFFEDAKIDGRSCTAVKVTHPTYDERLRFHTATVFVDNELRVPIHYEAYDWPAEKGAEPVLLEQYTYRDIKLNVGFSDYDFDPNNSDYKVQ